MTILPATVSKIILKHLALDNIEIIAMKEKAEEIKLHNSTEDDEPIVDIPFAQELGLSKNDVEWIRSVKESSMKLIAEQVEGYRSEGLNPLTRDIKTIKAWDLVLVHLMMLRDLKKYGPEIISNQTEKKLDEILAEIFSSYYFSNDKELKEFLELSRTEHDYEQYTMYLQMVRCLDDYKVVRNAKDKAAILSRVLNIWHMGGNNIVLGTAGINGIPKMELPISSEQKYFLEKLNNLGRDVK